MRRTVLTVEEQIHKLYLRKLAAEQMSAQWLMKANELDERISRLRHQARKERT